MSGIVITDEVVEVASKAYADHTEYYIQFHRGLSSPSADKIRAGMRKALEAALSSQTAESGMEAELNALREFKSAYDVLCKRIVGPTGASAIMTLDRFLKAFDAEYLAETVMDEDELDDAISALSQERK